MTCTAPYHYGSLQHLAHLWIEEQVGFLIIEKPSVRGVRDMHAEKGKVFAKSSEPLLKISNSPYLTVSNNPFLNPPITPLQIPPLALTLTLSLLPKNKNTISWTQSHGHGHWLGLRRGVVGGR